MTVPRPWATSSDPLEDLPDYGSPAWHALPDDDIRKHRALVIAAECWRIQSDPAYIEQRLHYELAGMDDDLADRQFQIEQSNRRSVSGVARRLLIGQPDDDVTTRPMHQTDDWPEVKVATHPNPMEMLAHLAAR